MGRFVEIISTEFGLSFDDRCQIEESAIKDAGKEISAAGKDMRRLRQRAYYFAQMFEQLDNHVRQKRGR